MVLQKEKIKNVKQPHFIRTQNETTTIYMAIFNFRLTRR